MPQLFLNFCIDTEGPLVETLGASFKRIQEISGLKIEASKENLSKIQNKEYPGLDVNISEKLADIFSKQRLDYANNWAEIKERMSRAMDPKFREKYSDSEGQALLYNLYIADFTGFNNNPREKCMTPHGVYDYYQNEFLKNNSYDDGVYWHYHHVPQSRNCHEWGRCFSTSGEYDQIISRNLIDRTWMPSVFRAGGHIEREDISFWLECWFPFDFSNQSLPQQSQSRPVHQDWSRSTKSWTPYHPDFYDVQSEGQMKRSIFRCLDINTRAYKIDEVEVEKAFKEAQVKDTILSMYTHDYRNVAEEVEYAMAVVQMVQKRYPEVELRNSNSLNAARRVLKKKPVKPHFEMKYKQGLLEVEIQGEYWGTQPYLAYKSYDGEYFHDNFCKLSDHKSFHYTFYEPEKVEVIAVGVIHPSGDTLVKKIIV